MSRIYSFSLLYLGLLFGCTAQETGHIPRERSSLNEGWRFFKYTDSQKADSLIYDVRPEVIEQVDGKAADARPTEGVQVEAHQLVLKPWILPTGNPFMKDAKKRYKRPQGNPGEHFPFVRADYDDQTWEKVTLPHDWAIKGPFYQGWEVPVGGGMGRLPVQGVAWYRRKLDIPTSDSGKSIFLEIEGAMSYAMVWLNGKLVGGWPYGYASWQVDLTPYIIPGGENQLAIRVDNPPASSRWYPGAGIYRHVWLLKTDRIHVGQWGTAVKTALHNNGDAEVDLSVWINNDGDRERSVEVITDYYVLDETGRMERQAVARFQKKGIKVEAKRSVQVKGTVMMKQAKLWGPPPEQQPNRYVAITTVYAEGKLVDEYKTKFGIRSLVFHPDSGLLVNNQHVFIKGVNQHHDLGALGAAFNRRAAERQLQLLREVGCNAIRMAHNPPAPELLELTDSMGFLVVDEIFDNWKLKKTPLDFHLIFDDWHEQDIRAFIRRDRNHPSIILWSFGNEVGEQYTDTAGARLAGQLQQIVKEEDPTRLTTVSMNYAKPNMPLPQVVDVISLNYQGEGIRNGPAYRGLKGITTAPLFPAFRKKFPDKLILSSENAAAVSSRGEYFFPVYTGNSAPVKDGQGGDDKKGQVSAYELYSVPFGSAPDKVFATMDAHPYVAGGFVWSGWDYLGEPTPYYLSKNSYFGLIDLAGFKKDRFYLYQSRWRPDEPMAHLLPHWNWPDRIGKVVPVHLFTSGDEAELFLNGHSLGRKKKQKGEYRIRWDEVTYTPGELRVVAYKNGKSWATDTVQTAGSAAKLLLKADKGTLKADGKDLVFLTVSVVDAQGHLVPQANHLLQFSIAGPAAIIATDNGDPTNLVSFASKERAAFNGRCLAIVRGYAHQHGKIEVHVQSEGLKPASVVLELANE